MTDVAHWRKRAQEMRGLANECSDPEEKQKLLKLAAEYDHLAKRAEKGTTTAKE